MTWRAGEGIVSSSRRRVPPRIAASCAARDSIILTSTWSPRSTSAGKARPASPAARSAISRGRTSIDHEVSPVCSYSAVAADSAARSRGRTCSRTAARSVPEASSAPVSSSTANVILRWVGSAPGSNAAAGTSAPFSALTSRARTSTSGAGARLHPLHRQRRGLGDRHQRAAQLLGQAAQQRGDQLLAERGHQPVEARGAQLGQHGQRDVHGDAVVLAAGLEGIGQRERQLALAPGARAAHAVSASRASGRTSSSKV